ncbi:glycosyltransferase [Dyadobacter crusticola]|uniref:glycosyltransferase n=1 Tax=Dyadobacter crusticola TaxID=292407 RepID=UPI000B25793F|nr:glycosyltransferase [Dyadobacter crusticola]
MLHVTGSMQPAVGGPCQGIRNLIPELAGQGISSEVVCVDDASQISFPEDPFMVHVLGPGVTPWQYTGLLHGWLEYNLERFDIVIVHGCWLYPGFATYKAWKKLMERSSPVRKPARLYFMPHGMLDPYFQVATGRTWKALRNWLYWKLIESKLINEADGLLFTCLEELTLARSSFKPYRPKNELNAGFGIPEPPAFKASMRQELDQKFPELKGQEYFLFLSRIHEKKGVELLLQVYLRLLERYPNLPRLVVAGPGMETPYGENARHFVSSRLLLRNHVTFTGMLSGDLKWAAFYGCQAFVLPSHQENFGIAIVEALACGKPVIISNKVNIWREIAGAECGVVRADTYQDTLAGWSEFIEMTASEKKAMGEHAAETYRQQFSVDNAVHQLMSCLLLDKVVQ